MGKHLCPKHGGQTGPLCCRHVIDAAMTGSKLDTPIASLDLDLMDDASVIVRVIVCASCATAGKLRSNSRISGKLWEAGSEDGTFPWVAPTCHICVDELDRRLVPSS
jgi:hypothetical protein